MMGERGNNGVVSSHSLSSTKKSTRKKNTKFTRILDLGSFSSRASVSEGNSISLSHVPSSASAEI